MNDKKYTSPKYRKPGRWEGLIGGLMALVTLGVQGTLLLDAINHPDQPTRWLVWAIVLAVLLVVDGLVIRAALRRRQPWDA